MVLQLLDIIEVKAGKDSAQVAPFNMLQKKKMFKMCSLSQILSVLLPANGVQRETRCAGSDRITHK
jgi:hypothetical protein